MPKGFLQKVAKEKNVFLVMVGEKRPALYSHSSLERRYIEIINASFQVAFNPTTSVAHSSERKAAIGCSDDDIIV